MVWYVCAIYVTLLDRVPFIIIPMATVWKPDRTGPI